VITAPEPSLPATSDSAEGQRLLSGVRSFVQTLLRLGIFLTRASIEKGIQRPKYGQVGASLVWGELNRVELGADAAIQLPRIDAHFIGAPLDVVLMATGNALTLVPVGYGTDGRTVPLINGAASVTFNKVGLYVLKTDGENWWMNAPG